MLIEVRLHGSLIVDRVEGEVLVVVGAGPSHTHTAILDVLRIPSLSPVSPHQTLERKKGSQENGEEGQVAFFGMTSRCTFRSALDICAAVPLWDRSETD